MAKGEVIYFTKVIVRQIKKNDLGLIVIQADRYALLCYVPLPVKLLTVKAVTFNVLLWSLCS